MASAYFDYQSSTPVLPEALEAMRPYWTDVFGTPSCLHQQGLRARDALNLARERVARLIRADHPEEILFTSGGTESANLAVKGVAWAGRRSKGHLVVGATEHPAVMRSVAFLESQGYTWTKVPVDREGWLEPEAVREALTEKTVLVCAHHANHDIGTLEPLAAISAVAAERGIPVFADAVASGGWEPIDVQALGVSLLSLAPHRFYGPKGVGVLYRHRRARLEPLLHGGMQEWERRAGTENLPAIVGAGVAAEMAAREGSERRQHTAKVQEAVWKIIREGVSHVKLNGPEPGAGRLSTNLNVSVEFVEGEGLALMCDVQGIALASGASCVSKALKASPVLEAIGLDRSLAQANVILSFGQENRMEEVRYFSEVFPKIVERLRGMSPMWEEFQAGRLGSVIAAMGAG